MENSCIWLLLWLWNILPHVHVPITCPSEQRCIIGWYSDSPSSLWESEWVSEWLFGFNDRQPSIFSKEEVWEIGVVNCKWRDVYLSIYEWGCFGGGTRRRSISKTKKVGPRREKEWVGGRVGEYEWLTMYEKSVLIWDWECLRFLSSGISIYRRRRRGRTGWKLNQKS